ncbi:DUF1700 domain-containing protein [Hespellia stercorisuis]|uniref:Uncharacterized membrane protein n=1 Tax=Hespellia stercorisuis DSM 15480 TaxID=1121950 RepID=A0A1M6KN16_9FIRM|nr:DUF1700 domain-containing protein [Hespellia stercorisuis]SHJ60408.1 Uncharacterized membrane protein [Hespellia stercorisuis DSM 15480]
MNRTDFMIKLESLLQDISTEERNEAMTYYREYFNDAGPENEDTIIKELVSPEKVAATIKAGLRDHDNSEDGEFSETGYTDPRFAEKEAPAARTQDGAQGSNTQTNSIIKIILIILIALAVASVAWPVLTGVAGAVIGITFAIIGLFIGLVCGAAAITLAGFILIIMGLTKIAVAFPTAIFTCGTGILIFVIGLIATVGTVKLCFIVYPAMFRFFVNIFRKIVHKGKAVL